MPEKKVLYQFSARGHDVAQIILGGLLDPPARRRRRLLSLAAAAAVARPLARGRASQAAGPLRRLQRRARHRRRLQPAERRTARSCCRCRATSARSTRRRPAGRRRSPITATCWATRAYGRRHRRACWAARRRWRRTASGPRSPWPRRSTLPMLFYIEDNGYGISVPARFQTPGGNIAANLALVPQSARARRRRLATRRDAARLIAGGRRARPRREGSGAAAPHRAAAVRPLGPGHPGVQDRGAPGAGAGARSAAEALRSFSGRRAAAKRRSPRSRRGPEATSRPPSPPRWPGPSPTPADVKRYVYAETRPDGTPELQRAAGSRRRDTALPAGTERPRPEPTRINMLTAIRRTLERELAINPKLLVFGEDVGPKGGVHAATMGLQDTFGDERVFDTSLSEEGIIGRAVGMAMRGLMPVPEIQFRKYADPATEQLNNCGTMRWRTHNRFAAPIVVRMPGGYGKCGDPVAQRVRRSPLGARARLAGGVPVQRGRRRRTASRARCAATTRRSSSSTARCSTAAWARRPYPGDDFVLPFGKAHGSFVAGNELTVVTWGAMVERCERGRQAIRRGRRAARSAHHRARGTATPCSASVRKTRRCLIVHEDTLTAGFGAEIARVIAEEAFLVSMHRSSASRSRTYPRPTTSP